MISELEIDGFKSLHNFKLAFSKGLNVLIGPNGAGKSNICQALGLIASAAEGPIGEYILSLGGAASVFSTTCSIDSKKPPGSIINASCKGETKADEGNVSLRYTYSFSIILNEELRIVNEYFRLFKKFKHNRYRIILTAQRQNETKLVIHIKNQKEIGPIFEGLKKRQRITFTLEEGPLTSSLRFLGMISYYCHLVRADMTFSRAWNIDPYLAKRSSDILEPSKMLSDGRRLPNAIHDMFHSKTESFTQINEFLSRILPKFGKIQPGTSIEGARTFSIIDAKGISCPAMCLSDGTVKALALLTGVLGHPHSTSIIEEPENYLHPWACQLLIEFFRDFFSDGVCILTTHSETVLNAINPKEIIIIENVDGATESHRLSRKKDLTDAIRHSGFGCGYHYLAGSLGGTP